MVLILWDMFLQLIGRDLLVLNDYVDLELLDTKAGGDKLGSTPDEAVLLDSLHILFKFRHIRLIPMDSHPG
jgi:hypothetical protein